MFIKKNWKDRQTEFPTRRTLTDVNTGTIQTVDVQRAEGIISQNGDMFDAETMNDLEERISNTLGEFSFGLTTDGKAGYKVGASSEIIPFKSTAIYYLGEGKSFDIKGKFPKDYSKFTADNFLVFAESGSASGSHSNVGYDSPAIGSNCSGGFSISKSYSNGVLTASCGISCSANVIAGGPSVSSSGSNTIGVKAYLVIGEIE